MHTNRLYILLISIVISAIMMLWNSSEEILTPPRQGMEEQTFPYAVAEHAATRHFGSNGLVDYAFTATKLEHYRVESKNEEDAAEEYTLIEQPHFTLYEHAEETPLTEVEEPWHIQASKGKLVRTGDNITLWNNVRIWQLMPIDTKNANNREQKTLDRSHSALDLATSELTTSFLAIDAIKKVAHTDEPVKITSHYGVINAVGMTADFRNRKIQLHKRVRATHKIPPQAK